MCRRRAELCRRWKWSREAEDRGALRRVVAANALEDPGAVVQAVDADVHLRVGPVDELAVHPDLLGLLHRRSPSFGLPCDALQFTRAVRGRSALARARRCSSAGGSAAMWRRRAGADPDDLVAEEARLSISARVTARCGNGATPPGSKPVACTTSSGRAIRDLGRRDGGRDRGLVRAAVAGNEREHEGAVADEDERLHDLGELAADRGGGVLRRRRRRPGTPRPARRPPPPSGRRRPRSTGSGQRGHRSA